MPHVLIQGGADERNNVREHDGAVLLVLSREVRGHSPAENPLKRVLSVAFPRYVLTSPQYVSRSTIHYIRYIPGCNIHGFYRPLSTGSVGSADYSFKET